MSVEDRAEDWWAEHFDHLAPRFSEDFHETLSSGSHRDAAHSNRRPDHR
jgi:hypothetical protein